MGSIRTKEADILKACKEYLSLRGHFCVRVNNGSFQTKSGGWFKAVEINGFPDIIGVTKHGLALAVECKSDKGKQRITQKAFETAWRVRGGLYVLARSIEDLQEAGL